MKGQIVNDIVVAYGSALSGSDVYDIPEDYSPERYEYIPAVAGVFDPSGFILKPEPLVVYCPHCSQPIPNT